MQNETESIVKEFLELWQKQYAYMSRDSDGAEQAIDSFLRMQEAYVDSIVSGLGSKANVKSAATSDIFGNIGKEFIKLAASHAKLEARIARLESLIKGGVATPAKETPAKKSNRARTRAAKTNN
jgi:hypothetical protein